MEELAFFGGPASFPAHLNAKFLWPIIDETARAAVLAQLEETVSIYDRSSVFEKFEDAFARYHGRKYALLSNSGTSSIHAMYDAVGLLPGDEVLCPVYTFHAAVSPMMSLGAVPVFCDCDEFGNVDPVDVRRKITSKTKGVMVTHMWGVPASGISQIALLCKENGLWLLEDCSHAHGASIRGQVVGTFGDAAAWSLQGQKIVTGGEGGILLTDDKGIYERALLHGHYNKRPKQEIATTSPYRKFCLTGKGLKLRAHPLAVALALDQFSKLPRFQQAKSLFASRMKAAFGAYSFIEHRTDSDCVNSWYAFTFHFNPAFAHGLSREAFVQLLHAEGLVEFEVPGSTGMLNDQALFNSPQELFPALYAASLSPQSGFVVAESFCSTVIKLPVWALDTDCEVVDAYIEGFTKVAESVKSDPQIADKMRTVSADAQ